jgi:chaperonin GroES
MSETVHPLGSRVLVRVEAQENVTPSGLYLPDTAKEKPQRGEVVAIGDDLEVIKVAVGDRVLFPKYTGTEVRLDDADHLLIESGDLIAILRGAPAPARAAVA